PRPMAEGPVTVGVVARQGAVKGYPDFQAALALLPADTPLRLLVAGDRDVALPERFTASRVPSETEAEMAALYQACDVFVFPSRSEGFGLPALEALASGCALLSTDCGGVREFARPNENCLLIPPGDPAALAEALLRLARDAAGYSRAAVSARFEQALLELAAARRRCARGRRGSVTRSAPGAG